MIWNFCVLVGMYGFEWFLNVEVFYCFEESYKLYGFIFFFVLVIILFCINVLVIGEVWKLLLCMCVECYKRYGDCMVWVVFSLLKVCVGLVVWLIVIFLEEDYYFCVVFGFVLWGGNDIFMSEWEGVEWSYKVEEYKSLFYIWVWIVLVVFVIFGIVVVIWKKCFLKDNFFMYSKWK